MARSLIDEAQQLDPTPTMRAELDFLLGLLLIHGGEDATAGWPAPAARSSERTRRVPR